MIDTILSASCDSTGADVRSSPLKRFLLTALAGVFLATAPAFAQCDCGSNDETAACTGQSIRTTIVGDANENRSVEITWTFNSGGEDAFCGQFANGDYWIAPATGQSGVTITGISGSGSGTVSADNDPMIDQLGLLSKDYGNLDPSQNIVPQLPVTYDFATSIVAAMERDEQAHGGCGTRAILGSCADAYQVVTVLDRVPDRAGSQTLRPNITKPNKDLVTLTDFDFSRLPSLDYLDGPPEALENIRQRWAHNTDVFALPLQNERFEYSEGGRAFRADLITDDYAAANAQNWHRDLMILFSSDSTLEEKTPALAAMLTYGKDLYHGVFNDQQERVRFFGTGAGQNLDRFPATVFFAAMSKDPTYGDALKAMVDMDVGSDGPHEIENFFVGPNGPVYGDGDDDLPLDGVVRYWSSVLANQRFDGASGNFASDNGGRRTTRDPHGYIDGPGVGPGGWYMGISLGPQRAYVAELLLIPQMCEINNYPPLIEYVMRTEDSGLITSPDPCAPPDPRENPETCDAFRQKGCEYFGLSNTGVATWGPDPNDLTKCIPNNSGGNTGQNGRFTSQHGAPAPKSYIVPQVENNWALIRGSAISNCASSTALNPPRNIQVETVN